MIPTTPLTAEAILRALAEIPTLERGSLQVLRQGANGPCYNHQAYEDGRNVTRYVPADQLPQLQEAIANHQRFETLVTQYRELLIQRTRAARTEGVKKKKSPPPRPNSSSPKTRKSPN